MGQNLNQELDPPAILQRLMTACGSTQGKWGKHSPTLPILGWNAEKSSND